ncbi:far upstream element-binding protein 3 isoform X2 [Euwallacea fornicatus]|uniref:far upstream element-binding protein 3 isoform X2 n=1 Tax=Euwallacea fornicatus TaxID=995702 RepID=UPI0033903BB8
MKMSEFSGVASAPPQQNFNQSSAFAAALQRAKQIAAKINPGSTTPENRPSKRPLEDAPEPETKKGPGLGGPPMGMSRPPQGGPPMNNGPPMSDDLKPPGSGGGPGLGGPPRMGGLGGPGGRNSVEIMIPGPKVGLIIGKGGETIKQLQEKSGAKMVVIQDGPGQELEKPLVISGDPQKVEYAKQLVYELMAEKEMKNFNNRGGRGGHNAGGGGGSYDDFGGGDFEVLVPKAAVGVVIGKGGEMIKKIQNETGCRVQFQQARDEGPGDRRCSLSGNPKQIEHARQKIEELIESVLQRDGAHEGGMGFGGRSGRGGRGGRGGNFGNRGNDRNGGGGGDYGGWNDRGGQASQEVQFVVPANKCGVIIGKGGETIKQINQQSGAYCELDRRSNSNQTEKTFTIKGDPDTIETAKRIISDKIQMPINFINMTGGPGGMNNSMPTAYPGMAPQGYNPQGWGMPNYGQQQQWGGPQGQGGDNNQNSAAGGVPAPGGAPGNVNPSGQPDYSLQWAEYYRSLGMVREAEMIEQQAKVKAAGGAISGAAPPTPQAAPAAAPAPATSSGDGQPDYSRQWAEYYRSIGKIKEAEAIESQMKNKSSGAAGAPGAAAAPAAPAAPSGGGYQQAYGGYQAPGGYYGQQPQAPSGGQQNYGYPQYGYGQPGGAPQNPPDGN